MRMAASLFYLLVLFLPTQLGLHFFLPFSQIEGVPIDYLIPTLYFTDLLVICIVVGVLYHKFCTQKKFLTSFIQSKSFVFLLVGVTYVLATSLMSVNVGAAVYKWVKIIEFLLLGWAIVQIRPNIKTVLLLLGVGVFFESLIAFGQFYLGRSIGFGLWWLGERSFYASTPGITTFSYDGALYLRPYATFPHPNVLGGFLALSIVALLWGLTYLKKLFEKNEQIFLTLSCVIGMVALLLTVSRAAWIVFILGIFLLGVESMKRRLPPVFISVSLWILGMSFLSSILIPLFFPQLLTMGGNHWMERGTLLWAATQMVSLSPFIGVGLNNFLVNLPSLLTNISSYSIFQPVHNIYMLILSETGFIGFCFFLIALYGLYQKSNRSIFGPLLLFLLLFLGLFDHYLITLQQGQLLFVLIASLTYIKKT